MVEVLGTCTLRPQQAAMQAKVVPATDSNVFNSSSDYSTQTEGRRRHDRHRERRSHRDHHCRNSHSSSATLRANITPSSITPSTSLQHHSRSPEEWLEQRERITTFNYWDDEATLRQVLLYLEGPTQQFSRTTRAPS